MKKNRLFLIMGVLLVFLGVLFSKSKMSKNGFEIVITKRVNGREGIIFTKFSSEELKLRGTDASRILGPLMFFETKERVRWAY